jgi:hypothetical protein
MGWRGMGRAGSRPLAPSHAHWIHWEWIWHVDAEPKIWAVSPDESTPWGPNQAGGGPFPGDTTRLVPAPSYVVAVNEL